MAEGATSDPAQLKAAAEREHRRRLLEQADVVKMLETEGGRRLAYRLVFEFGRLLDVSGPVSDELMRFNDGRRSVGADLLQLFKDAAPESWWKMLEEQQKAAHLSRVLATEPSSSVG